MHVEEGPAGYSRGLHTFVLSRPAPGLWRLPEGDVRNRPACASRAHHLRRKCNEVKRNETEWTQIAQDLRAFCNEMS